MNIKFIGIQNFRKLKNCKIDFDSKQTILVGSNGAWLRTTTLIQSSG